MSRRIKKPIVKQEKFGRPPDDPLEVIFMNKLREGKLKVIHAQSQAQIECFQHHDKNPQIYLSNGSKAKKQKNKNYSLEKIEMLRQIFDKKDKVLFQNLYKSFKAGAENWKFKQITCQEDFPEFLFDDQCDLSYVLHYCLNNKTIESFKNKAKFEGRELLFLELLCFAARDQISFKTILTFQQYYDQIIEQLDDINQKIKTFCDQIKIDQQILIQENIDQNENIDVTCDIPIHLRKGQLKNVLQEAEEDSHSYPKKTKTIQKIENVDKKKGRPKKSETANQDQQMIPIQDFEQLLNKLIVHIVWAYIYIYPAVSRKRPSM